MCSLVPGIPDGRKVSFLEVPSGQNRSGGYQNAVGLEWSLLRLYFFNLVYPEAVKSSEDQLKRTAAELMKGEQYYSV